MHGRNFKILILICKYWPGETWVELSLCWWYVHQGKRFADEHREMYYSVLFLPGESHGERSLVGYRPVIKSWTQLKWLSTVHTLGRAWTSDHRICQAETLFPLDLDHMLSKLLSHLELPLTSSIMPPSSFCVGEQFLIAPFFTSFQLFIQQVLWTLSHSINTIIPACQELCKCFFIGLPASILS